MTFLPIAERELRVASRKRSTFWLRIVAAMVALVISCGFLAISMGQWSGMAPTVLGKALFSVLSGLSFAAAASAGFFFTSDCLSEEKREGTLGFLFLTDLRGYDIVLGKLLATSLRTFYALLAVLPILAITILMGGVTGMQFWLTVLALVNALLMALAQGMFVSAISRDSQKAQVATAVLLLLLLAGGPAIDAGFAAAQGRSFSPVLSLSSPAYLFAVATSSVTTSDFWPSFLINQVIACLLLGLSSLLLPRVWQEKAARISQVNPHSVNRWTIARGARQAMFRRKLLDLNPVLWLLCRRSWHVIPLWIVGVMLAGGFAAFTATGNSMIWFTWSYLAGALTLMLYVWIASQASGFFVEAQRSGLTELLLATPLTVIQIVHGRWRALLRMFVAPVALCLIVQLLGTFLTQQKMWSQIRAATPATTTRPRATPAGTTTTATTNNQTITVTRSGTTTTTTISVGGLAGPNELLSLVTSLAGIGTVAANLVALSWFGMWMGLNSRSTNMSTLKTITFVQIIPWFAVTFASVIAVQMLLFPVLIKGNMAGGSQIMVWYPLITSGVTTVLSLTKDVAFVVWARRKLYSDFRARAVRALAPIRLAQPPPLPVAIARR